MGSFGRSATLLAAIVVAGLLQPATSATAGTRDNAGDRATARTDTAGTGGAGAGVIGAGTGARLQAEIDAYLREHPGGVQVSDQALAYRGGDVVVVFPDPGRAEAPDGLGRNVRIEVARENNVAPMATAYRRGCPYSTVTNADWYCFYTDANWRGRRLQFRDTCADYASNWGFNNQTSSWVNTNGGKRVHAYDSAGGTLLWIEATGISESSWVGAARNDRLSFWRVHGGGC